MKIKRTLSIVNAQFLFNYLSAICITPLWVTYNSGKRFPKTSNIPVQQGSAYVHSSRRKGAIGGAERVRRKP